MTWFGKFKFGIGIKKIKPEEVWVECKGCHQNLHIPELEQNFKVCPKCDYHFRLSARERIDQLLDPETFVEHNQNLTPADPLKFKDKKKYKDRIKASTKKGDSNEAMICASGKIGEFPVEICAFEFSFMGGSMGSVVGEKITRSIEQAITNRVPLIIFSCSGGARMQEGIFSLMQMAKTSSALQNLANHHLPFISILTDPTMGGVSASFAMLGDIIIAEPGALIGFAGPRVIEQTIQQKLPPGFQTAEFLLEHGLIDNVVHRRDMKTTLVRIFGLLREKNSRPG